MKFVIVHMSREASKDVKVSKDVKASKDVMS
jgi:hypothetical protein